MGAVRVPGQSWDAVAAEAIAVETRRLYWSTRWIGPVGSFLAALIVVALVWTQVQDERLLVWLGLQTALAVVMAIGFCAPDRFGGTTRSGLSRLTELSHLGVGLGYGSLLWLSKAVCDDPVARWTMLAAMFAITAGVTTGLSGLGRLSLLTIIPMWTMTSIGLVRAGEYAATLGAAVFVICITIDQLRTARLWRELITLRIGEARQAEENAWAAKHDPLTGLLNRYGVTTLLDSTQSASTAMFVDLDHFKQVNDRFGHAAGDEVLRQVAQRLLRVVRSNDHVARMGGDEFFIAFDGTLAHHNAHGIGRSIIDTLEEPFQVEGAGEILISASVGFTTLTPDQATSSRLIIESDHAMLHAKRRGRRQVMPFTANLEAELEQRSGLESAFRHAIRNGSISYAAQPGFDLRTGKVVGVELLARWQLESGVWVPPSVFVPLAEEVGLIGELTDLMLHAAGRCLTEWAAVPELCDAPVAVNISPIQVAKGGLLDRVADIMQQYRIGRHRLALELTESAVLNELPSAVQLFSELRDLGVMIAIDDFGTGYSSLGHLLRLPITAIKIDRSLIAGLGIDPRQQAVMVAIRDLAGVLGQSIVAEGIEHPRQVEALRSIGITLGQGFGLLRPVSIDELAEHVQLLDWSDITTLTNVTADHRGFEEA